MKKLMFAAVAAVGLGFAPVSSAETMSFPADETSSLVLEADRELTGLVFGNGSKVTISGGYALTVNVASDTGMDQYGRLFAGNTELTVTGESTTVAVNPKGGLGQSSNMSITARDGASFTNTKWYFGDNGGYALVASGEGSTLAMTLQNASTWYEVASGYRFEASDGATLKITRGNYSLDFNNANHGLVVTADEGALALTGVKVTAGAPTLTLKGAGTAAFEAFTPASGTLTLVPDASWDAATPRLMTTGNLSFNGELTVDASVLGEIAGKRKLLVGQAGGTVTLNPSKVTLTGAAEGVTAVCSVEGKNAYVTLSGPVLPSVGQRKLGLFVDYTAKLSADYYCDFVRDYLAPNGFDTFLLLFDMNYAYESHPVGDNKTTKADVEKIAAACKEYGIELIPAVELLGHQAKDRDWGILKTYPELDESYSKTSVEENYARSLCPRHPDSLGIACDLMDELVAAAGAKTIHICCDEVFEIGVCDRCKDIDRGKLFADWVNALNRHNREKGVETMIWGDRLIKRSGTPYDKWESSENGTDTALALLDKDIVICDWHYYASTFPSVDLFTAAGFKTWICPWNNLESTRKFIAYADEHEVNGKVAGIMLTEWGSLDTFVAALNGSTDNKDCANCASVFNYIKRPVPPPAPPAGTAFWRWTSNAMAGEPTWFEVGDETLSVPAFTGSTAADNVLELLNDCAVTSALQFSKDCTIRTQPGLDVKTVTFAKGMTAAQDTDIHKVYCDANAAVVTSNITFQGNIEWQNTSQMWVFTPASSHGTAGYANLAWRVNTGKSLTLGPGTTVRNILTSSQHSAAGSVGGAIVVCNNATLNVEDGVKITDCRGDTAPIMILNACVGAVVNMKGGEITRCYAGGDRGGAAIGGLQGTINLTGGWIHGNISYKSGSGGVYIFWNGGGTAPKINISGKPVIEDNYLGLLANSKLSNLTAADNDYIHLAGDLEEGAYVGCSQDLGEGSKFGVADDAFVGARYIHADDGSGLVGVVKDVNGALQLQWSSTVDPEPNRWKVKPAVEPDEWVSGDEPGTIIRPVAAFGDATKVATISKDGGDPVAWDETIPEDPGAYAITWTVAGTTDYAALEGSVEFTVLGETHKYWRWTSNATADEPTWIKSDNPVLTAAPAFEGATAEDNVLELLDDCTVEGILVFNKSCTIRTNPECGVKKVTFAKNCYCISTAGADIHTADITFTGGAQWSYPTPQYQWFWNAGAGNSTTAGNCAWAVIGTASLTLGAGTTVRDFLSAVPTGIGGTSYGGAIMLPAETTAQSPLGQKGYANDAPALTISEGVKILDVRSNNSPAIFIAIYSAKAVVTMTGGEISECYNGNGGPNYAGTIYVGNGTFNLSGGTIHGNYANSSDYAGVNVYNGTLRLSGTPIVQNNFKTNGKNVTSNHELRNMKVSGSGSIHLAGDLEEGAYVGCSQNIGENFSFGKAERHYRGAEFIHADDGSKLVGRVRQGNLVWGVLGGFMLLVR